MLLGEHEKGVKAVEGADLVGAAELENEQEAALVGEIDLLRSGKAAVFVESILESIHSFNMIKYSRGIN